jgi:hypothetical protein
MEARPFEARSETATTAAAMAEIAMAPSMSDAGLLGSGRPPPAEASCQGSEKETLWHTQSAPAGAAGTLCDHALNMAPETRPRTTGAGLNRRDGYFAELLPSLSSWSSA